MASPWVPRVLLGVGLAALIGAIISLSVGTGGPKVIKITGGDAVQELIGGVQQNGPSLGDPNAPVTVALFTDLQCSTCDTYELETVDPLIEEYARGSDVRFGLVEQHRVRRAPAGEDAGSRRVEGPTSASAEVGKR